MASDKIVTFNYGYKGASSGDIFSTSIGITGNSVIGAAALNVAVENLAKAVFFPCSTDMVCFAALIADNTLPKPKRSLRPLSKSLVLDVNGGRAEPNGKDIADFRLALRANLIPDTAGRNGSIEVRGGVFEDEFTQGANDSYALIRTNGELPAWVAQWEAKLKAADTGETQFQLGPGRKLLTVKRSVEKAEFAGIVNLQLEKGHTSPQQKIKEAVRSLLNTLRSDYVDATTADDGTTIQLDATDKAEFTARANRLKETAGGPGTLREIGIPKEIKVLFPGV